MNVKKYLKQKAQEDIKSLQTDKDQEILQRLKNSVAEEPPKKRRSLKWLWAIPSAVAFTVAAVLIVELVPFPNNDSGGVRYDEVNFVHVNSNMSELSNSLSGLTLHVTDTQNISVARTYDSLSGDNLYFTLSVAENLIYSLELRIVVNENYDHEDFIITDEFKTASYPDYTITYKLQITPYPDFDGLNIITCTAAKIDNAKYEMYVMNYEEYAVDDGTFLTVINNLLDFHN